jgi:hypothetical protein
MQKYPSVAVEQVHAGDGFDNRIMQKTEVIVFTVHLTVCLFHYLIKISQFGQIILIN